MPLSEKDEDMPKWGWVKSLMYEKILCSEETQGRVILFEFDYYAGNQRCGTCKSNEYVWITVPSHNYATGVLVACSRCKRTWGPIAEEYASNTRTREVTPDEGIEMCMRTKQPIPEMLERRHQAVLAEKEREKRGISPRPPKIGT